MINYFFKYYIYDGNTKRVKSSFILPLLTIVIGCFVMMLSFAIMEGFSNKISDTIYFFDKKHSIIINKKIFNNKKNDQNLDSLIQFLIQKEYFFNAYEDRVMFINGNSVSRVYGINNFNTFKPIQFILDDYNVMKQDYNSGCYLGYNQFINLDINLEDKINVASILDFQNLNIFPERNFNVINIIKTNIPRYDNSIFIPFDSLLFSKNIFININLNKKISKNDSIFINNTFNQGIIYNRDIHLFSELIYAIHYEKLFYAFFGLFIVLISSIMLMGFNVSSIITNIHSITLLETLGFQKKYISFSYFVYGLFISILGFCVSLLLFNILLFLDTNYQLMDYIFDPAVYFDFDLILNSSVLVAIFSANIMLIFLSTLYPLYKISKLDIIDSIKSRV
tara:strand:+ start:2846 stop:4024 length:1179 start_codon:yes stop_codon:yes gene_type:complete